jgi:hypothetical protein
MRRNFMVHKSMTYKSRTPAKIALIGCKWLVFSAVLLLGVFFSPQAHAQYIGSVELQTVQTPNLLLDQSCGPSQSGDVVAIVQNVGQTVHFLTYSVTPLTPNTPAQLVVYIEGSYDAIHYFPISNSGSDDLIQQTSLITGITGQGYYPAVRVHFQCYGTGFLINTASYSGTSVTRAFPTGLQSVGEYSVNYVLGASAGSSNGPFVGVYTPYGNSAGIVSIESGTLPAGSQLVAVCDTGTVAAFNLATSSGQQNFTIPPQPCTTLSINFVSGGASASTYQLNMTFQQPGFSTATVNATFSGTITTNPPPNASTNVSEIGGTAVIADPCRTSAKVYGTISQTASAQLITGTAATKISLCSFNVVGADAENLALVEGTGSVCGTTTVTFPGLSGGATAATGWNFSANGGISFGVGGFSLGTETTAADNVCLLESGSGQVSGGFSYVVQ